MSVLEYGLQAGRGLRLANPSGRELREVMGRPQGHKLAQPILPRKASSEPSGDRTANRHR